MAHMRAMRSDARRSRERILEVARAKDRHDLRLNDLAREAGVGVGTVYRHFPTTEALRVALAQVALTRLQAVCEAAQDEDDPWEALCGLIDATLTLQLEDNGLQDVLLSGGDATAEAGESVRAVLAASEKAVARAHETGVLREEITAGRLQHLLCGLEHAVRVGQPSDRPVLQQVLLSGIRTRV